MELKRKRSFLPVLVLGLFCILGLLFVPECDDCYYAYWKYESLKDVLIIRPSPEDMHAYGLTGNGRYLGNQLGVIQGKLYFTPVGFLRGLLFGGALTALALLLGRRFSPGAEKRGEGLALAFSLVALAPRGIWQQVYSWGAAFMNYLIPMVGILILLELLEKKRPVPVMCLSLCCCLFMETVTILMFVATIAYAVYSFLRERERFPTALASALGAVLGTIIMFSHPGYAEVGSDHRAIGLNMLRNNLIYVISGTLIRPAAVALLISILLVWLLKRQGRVWQPWALLLSPVHILCVIDTLRNYTQDYDQYDVKRMLLACVLAVIWLILLWQWKGGAARRRVLAGVLALCIVNAPLLVVSPVEPRVLFPGYVILMIIASLLWREAGRQGFKTKPLKLAWVPGAVACVLFIAIYAVNFQVYHQRLDIARLQVDQGAEEMTLPLVPFPGWTVNEQQNKGDICFLVYRNIAWDVPARFVPYSEFVA